MLQALQNNYFVLLYSFAHFGTSYLLRIAIGGRVPKYLKFKLRLEVCLWLDVISHSFTVNKYFGNAGPKSRGRYENNNDNIQVFLVT